MTSPGLEYFFNSKSIAVMGTSNNKRKISYNVLNNIMFTT
jgi:predicted CoA-binding protein